MASNRPSPSPVLCQQICAFIRAGGYAPVAAEAAGVPRRLFAKWLARGLKRRARGVYRAFAEAIRQAEAQARLGAEMAAYKKDALNWLKSGPGRERPRRPGWSMPVRARPGAERGAANPLLHPAAARVLAGLLQALTPFPEARAAAAAVLSEPPGAEVEQAAPSPPTPLPQRGEGSKT
jgi:hypothetical protein